LCARFSKLKIVGIHDGYFPHQGEANEKLVEEINLLRPDILIVALGMPLQEKWLYRNQAKLNVPILLSGGGVLDYTAGRLGRAPSWMIRMKLEWLFRICEEPRRLFWRYAVDIPYFLRKVVFEATKNFIWRLFRK
jgi:exopolysaccharide biosynthesis WecB/TagA/CpsF family protein